MLSLAFTLLTTTVLAGSVLALRHLRGARRSPGIGALHGTLGAAGLAALVPALRGPARGIQTGTGSFGLIAAVLAAVALLLGLGVLLLARRAGPAAGPAIAVHAVLAITAYVMLAAYVALP